MKEFEVGMYVRTNGGYICKLININDFREPGMKYGIEANYLKDIVFIGDEDISKASYNIIDLIEVGDYVNGYKVTAIYNPNGDDIFNFTLIMEHGYKTINPYIRHYPIKSIVTKEQFDSMKYVVGGKE